LTQRELRARRRIPIIVRIEEKATLDADHVPLSDETEIFVGDTLAAGRTRHPR
jgi:hypothetical protein